MTDTASKTAAECKCSNAIMGAMVGCPVHDPVFHAPRPNAQTVAEFECFSCPHTCDDGGCNYCSYPLPPLTLGRGPEPLDGQAVRRHRAAGHDVRVRTVAGGKP